MVRPAISRTGVRHDGGLPGTFGGEITVTAALACRAA
jgi:hypothetical protein